jgi:hypothetical protein
MLRRHSSTHEERAMAKDHIADDKTHDSTEGPIDHEPRFLVPLPGGRVARVPLEVLEEYVDETAKSAHAASRPSRGPGQGPEHSTTIQAGESMVTINIYTGRGDVNVARHDEDDDVTAHSLAVDAATGMSEWHTDWEYGECEYTDESGFPQRIQAWHRHPFGTEYTELYEG